MFTRWGRLVYRFKWPTLLASVLLLAGSILLLLTLPAQAPSSSSAVDTQSGRANNLISQQTPQSPPTIDFVFSSTSRIATDPAFQSAMQSALTPLQTDSRVKSVVTPYTASGPAAAALQSRNGHEALAVATLAGDQKQAENNYAAVRALVHSPTLTVTATGSLATSHDFSYYLSHDLQSTSNFVFVVALLLLVVFGTLVAAGLPLLTAIAAEVGGLAIGVNVLSHHTDVSQYATNLIALIGLGVAIDYSLFIVSRFREELAAGSNEADAIAATVATAGRAVVFSGVTVGIGLCGLLFFQGVFIASMGGAAAIAVLLAVRTGFGCRTSDGRS